MTEAESAWRQTRFVLGQLLLLGKATADHTNHRPSVEHPRYPMRGLTKRIALYGQPVEEYRKDRPCSHEAPGSPMGVLFSMTPIFPTRFHIRARSLERAG